MTDWVFADHARDEPRYAISVVAARCGVHKGTLRRYEEWGLLEPARAGQRRSIPSLISNTCSEFAASLTTLASTWLEPRQSCTFASK